MRRILFCPVDHRYTLKSSCPQCGQPTVSPQPPRYSPDDPYGQYRRQAKEEALRAKGLL